MPDTDIDSPTDTATPRDLPTLLLGVLDTAIALTGADFGNVQLLDPDHGLRIVTQRGFDAGWVDYWNAVTTGMGSCGAALGSGERVIVEDVETSPIFVGTPALDVQRRAGVRSVQSTPIRSLSGPVLGMFSTHSRRPGRSDTRTLKVLDLLAAHAASLIELKQVEERLRESEAQFRQVMQGGPIIAARIGRDLRYQWVYNAHPAFAADAAIGRRDDELSDNAGARRLMELKRRVMEDGQPVRELVGFDLPGGERTWDVAIEPLHDADGRVAGARSVAFDVTERRRQDAELQAYRLHLEQLVAARTDELRRARDAAHAASVAKSAFLTNMSHELRTPLNAVMGMAHLVRRGGLDARQTALMDRHDVASGHLLGIVDAVLDLSRIEAGRFELKDTDCRVADVVAHVATMIQPEADRRGLRLLTEVGPMPPRLTGDALRLEQALLNYADNAVKFTHSGSVTLRARVEADDGDSVLLHFEVEDSGERIPPDVLPRLFAAFEQGDSSLTRRHGGTGLGLAITRRIAGLMDGDAGVSSVPGKGSTFWFTARLRAPRAQPGVPAPVPTATDPEAVLRSRYPGARVLVVDDDAVNRRMVGELLACASLVPVEAADGAQAVAAVARKRFDLVLMDVLMPGMDGLTATARIRALPLRGRLPVLALTGNAFEDQRERCLAVGMNDFITKPVRAQLLYEALLRALDANA